MGNLGVAWALFLAIGAARSKRPLVGPLWLTGGLGTLALAGIIALTTGARADEVVKLQLQRKAMSLSAKAYGYEILANYEEDRGNLPDADAYLHEAIETIPGNLRLYGALGEIQLERGDTTEAVESLWKAMKSERALRTAPLLGELLVRRNQLDDALEVLLGMGPSLYEDRRASAALCVAYSKLGMPDSSLAVAKRRIERDPGDAQAHMNAAAALTRSGEMEEAIEHLRIAVSIDPKNMTYRMRLIDLLRREPDGEIKAREYLRGLEK